MATKQSMYFLQILPAREVSYYCFFNFFFFFNLLLQSKWIGVIGGANSNTVAAQHARRVIFVSVSHLPPKTPMIAPKIPSLGV